MPGNAGQSLDLNHSLVWHLSAGSPVGDNARVIEPQGGGCFGQPAKVGDDTVNDVLRLFHAGDYHTA